MLALFALIYRHEEMLIARLVALADYAPVMLEMLMIIANLTTVSLPSYHPYNTLNIDSNITTASARTKQPVFKR